MRFHGPDRRHPPSIGAALYKALPAEDRAEMRERVRALRDAHREARRGPDVEPRRRMAAQRQGVVMPDAHVGNEERGMHSVRPDVIGREGGVLGGWPGTAMRDRPSSGCCWLQSDALRSPS